MTDKERAEHLWESGPWWCIECDESLEVKEDAYLHPHYDNEIVCAFCHNRLSQTDPFDDFEDSVEDWELLGLDPDTPQDEVDNMWDNQM